MRMCDSKKKRPENWEEVSRAYMNKEISSAQAAEQLGISGALFFRYLHRDFPLRKDLRKDHAYQMSQGNRKYSTYLEKNFTDAAVCKMLRVTENCGRCPMTRCNGEKKCRGIRAKMVERVTLKADGKPLEDKA